MRIVLDVNGERYDLDLPAERRLADVLRGDLGLTGTKIAVGRARAGPVRSWSTAVQEAFVVEDALQCGFRTPGHIVTATALLAATPSPTREQVRAAIAGNLCRCGAYPKIERAVLRAAGIAS